MVIKSIISATCTCLAVVSFNVGAVLTDNGLLTTDDTTGLNWLDLAETANLTYTQVYNETQSGGLYDGYHIATTTEINALFSTYNFNSQLWSLWGATSGALSTVMYDDPAVDELTVGASNNGFIDVGGLTFYDAPHFTVNDSELFLATALVQTVPIPSAVWLFGSGLLGLTGLAKRKAKSKQETNKELI